MNQEKQKEEKRDLSGITVGPVTLVEYIDKQERKQTDSVYMEEVKEKSHKTPIPLRPKYRSKKERSGKVMTITNKVYNKRIENNLEKCEDLRGIVISIFLSGQQLSVAELDDYIINVLAKDRANSNVKAILRKMQPSPGTTPYKRQKLFNLMSDLKNSRLKNYIFERSNVVNGRTVSVYYFNDYGLNSTFEEMNSLASKRIPKKKIKKPVKDHKKNKSIKQGTVEYVEDERIENLNKLLSQVVKEEYQGVIQNIINEVNELKSLVNQLMINKPSSDLGKAFGVDIPKVIKIDIPTNFYFHFGFSLVEEKGERK